MIGCRELRRYVKGEAKGATVFGEAEWWPCEMGRAMSSATHLFWTMRLMFLKATYWISGWDDSMVTGGKEGRGKMGGKGGGGGGEEKQ